MKKILIIVIIVLNILCNISLGTDYDNHWAKDTISRGISNGNISGYTNGLFLPNDSIRVNEFLKMLIKCNESQMCDGIDKWDETYINYAYENKYILDKNEDFKKQIIREEAFKILYRYICSYYSDEKKSEYIFQFSDYTGGLKEINYLVEIGIIKGFSDNTLRLTNGMTRAEAISTIYRVNDYLNDKFYSEKFNQDIFDTKNINEYINYMNNEIFLNDFKFENEICVYRDRGRIEKYSNEKVDKKRSEYIKNVILNLINKNNYVVNTLYRYDNSVHIFYGEKASYMSNGSYIFEIVLYDKESEYIAKVEVYKLWKELNEIRNNILVNKYYEDKLKNILKIYLTELECTEIIASIKNGMAKDSERYILEKNGFKNTIYLKG